MIEHDSPKTNPLDFPAPHRRVGRAAIRAREMPSGTSLVAGIMTGAAPELARRRNERGFVRSILRLGAPGEPRGGRGASVWRDRTRGDE